MYLILVPNGCMVPVSKPDGKGGGSRPWRHLEALVVTEAANVKEEGGSRSGGAAERARKE